MNKYQIQIDHKTENKWFGYVYLSIQIKKPYKMQKSNYMIFRILHTHNLMITIQNIIFY